MTLQVRSRILFARILPISTGIIAIGLATLASSASQTAPSAERGAQLAAMWCSSCHATGATSQGADLGPTFVDIARRRSPDYLRSFLANPHARGAMPPFDLAREHTEDLVAYFQTLK